MGAFATYRGTVKAKTIETQATPYERLSDRVGMLEAQVDDLIDQKWSDRAFIRLLTLNWPDHIPLPTPMPAWVAGHYGVVPKQQPDEPDEPPEPPAVVTKQEEE